MPQTSRALILSIVVLVVASVFRRVRFLASVSDFVMTVEACRMTAYTCVSGGGGEGHLWSWTLLEGVSPKVKSAASLARFVVVGSLMS